MAEAIALHEQVLAARQCVLGPDHSCTLASPNNLAEAYRRAGRAAEAVMCMSTASGAGEELVRMLLGPRWWALYHLNALSDSAAQAIVAGEPLATDFERVLGPDRPSTLGSWNNLAAAYREARRAD
jgi:hypothetical protein